MQQSEVLSAQFLTEFHKEVRNGMPTVPQILWETICNRLPGPLGERLYPIPKRPFMIFILWGSRFGSEIGLSRTESEIFGVYFMNRVRRNSELNSGDVDLNVENANEALIDSLIEGDPTLDMEKFRPLRSSIKNAAGATASYLLQPDLNVENMIQIINHHLAIIYEQRTALDNE